MQKQPRFQSYLTSIACNRMTGLWSVACVMSPREIARSPERMQLDDLKIVLCNHPLRWHDLVERSDGWLKKVQKFNHKRGRPEWDPLF